MFDLILADPPWRYDFASKKNQRIENHYPTMALTDICALDVHSICNPQAILFLWATAPKLREGLKVMEAWGFEYKTFDVWLKVPTDKHRDQLILDDALRPAGSQTKGLGYYWRNRHEPLLVGTRGGFSPPHPSRRLRSGFSAEVREHSRKPEIARQRIEAMYPDAKRVELFARERHEGWAHWGNELPTTIRLGAA